MQKNMNMSYEPRSYRYRVDDIQILLLLHTSNIFISNITRKEHKFLNDTKLKIFCSYWQDCNLIFVMLLKQG